MVESLFFMEAGLEIFDWLECLYAAGAWDKQKVWSPVITLYIHDQFYIIFGKEKWFEYFLTSETFFWLGDQKSLLCFRH